MRAVFSRLTRGSPVGANGFQPPLTPVAVHSRPVQDESYAYRKNLRRYPLNGARNPGQASARRKMGTTSGHPGCGNGVSSVQIG